MFDQQTLAYTTLPFPVLPGSTLRPEASGLPYGVTTGSGKLLDRSLHKFLDK